MITEYLTLGDVCTKGSSNIAQKELDGNEGEYEIYGASGLIKKVNFFHQDKPYIAVVKDGAGVGRTMLLPAKSSVIGTMQYIIPCDNVDIEYLYYAITYMDLSRYYMGAAIPHIYFKDYKKEKLPVPDIDTQKRIAAKFRLVDKLITFRQSQLSKLSELTASRFIELFGNFVYDRNKWKTCEVGDVAETIDPQPSHRTPPVSSDGIPYIGIAECNYKTRSIDFDKARKVGCNVLQEHLGRYSLEDGDFIIGKIGTIGKPFFIPTKQSYVLSANTVLIKPNKERVEPLFLFAFFQSEYMDIIIDAEKKSTSQPAFGIQKVRKIEIPLPPLGLQQQFSAFVAQTDKSKFYARLCIDLLQNERMRIIP